MNKIKIGKFLKELRKERKKTMGDIVNELEKKYICVTSKTISDWEKGKSLPDVDKLIELADIYKVTVDEILDGERLINADYSKIYYISNRNWANKYQNDKTINLYAMNNEQIIKINNSFERLLKQIIIDELTSNEESEFNFLFNNFYKLSDYCIENFSISSRNNYLILKNAILMTLNETSNMNNDEKFWKLKKLIKQNNELLFSIHEICDGVPQKDSYVDQKFRSLKFWEKDIILAAFQVIDFITIDYETMGSKALKEYEQKKGCKFEKEKINKNIIKYLIKNGACINEHYLNFVKVTKETYRIIDRLEELYNKCKKPIQGAVIIDGNYKKYYVENTPKNRFFKEVYYSLKHYFENFSPEELYKILRDKKEIPHDMLINIAKKNNIDTACDERYIRSDLFFDISFIEKELKEYIENEKEITNGLIELSKLLNKLKKGEIEYTIDNSRLIGGKNWEELYEYYNKVNQFLTLRELYELRKEKETKALLEEIDKLTTQEIRNKYFCRGDIN